MRISLPHPFGSYPPRRAANGTSESRQKSTRTVIVLPAAIVGLLLAPFGWQQLKDRQPAAVTAPAALTLEQRFIAESLRVDIRSNNSERWLRLVARLSCLDHPNDSGCSTMQDELQPPRK
jgi:hypothetical protein